MLSWWGFTVTFAFLRFLTWIIHIDVGFIGDVQAGGVHLHHYLWGILVVMIVGAVAMWVDRSSPIHTWLGLFYGIGMALVIDEAALLLQLRDVYWDSSGGISIGLAILLIGIVGSILVFTRSPGSVDADASTSEPSPEPAKG